MKVQFADVGIAGKPYETDVLAAAIRVLKSGNYIGGSEVEALEREFVEFCGAAEAVSVRTGTDALTFALRAAGVGLGDEVITVPLTFIATAEAISHAGATPVFVDVDAETALTDTRRVAAAIPRPERGRLPLARRLRAHGQSGRYPHGVIGYSGRLDALQAAILRVKLRALDAANAQRRKLALRYEEALGDIPGLVLPRHPAHVLPVWHLYVIQVPQRDRVQEKLAAAGIETGLHYPTPVHLQRAYRFLGYQPGDFPVSEQLAEDRKSTRLNSSHRCISYAVFCLKKKTTTNEHVLHNNTLYHKPAI